LRARTILRIHEWGERFNTFGPFQTTLDDNSFADYHVFRASSRMLPSELESFGDGVSRRLHLVAILLQLGPVQKASLHFPVKLPEDPKAWS
jgi:hypothetical protein